MLGLQHATLHDSIVLVRFTRLVQDTGELENSSFFLALLQDYMKAADADCPLHGHSFTLSNTAWSRFILRGQRLSVTRWCWLLSFILPSDEDGSDLRCSY